MSTLKWLVAAVTWMLMVGELSGVHGFSCWAQRNEGSETCGLLVSENVTVEECCSNNGESISWTTLDEISAGEMFKYEAIYGGVPDCNLCEKTCDQTTCPDGRRCVMKSGRPRCVCKPDCTHNSTSHRGAVCATNGRQYKSMCALLKMKCRQQDQYFEMDVAYYGACQDSCDNVECIGNKCCVEDQRGRPHCVSYNAISCPGPFRDEFVCGADNVTYETLCQLRRTSCSKGNIIPVAYEGKCKDLVSCNDTSCVHHKECFWDQPANTSRCILCNYNCSGWADQVPVCASNNQTYDSWCSMQEYICQNQEYVGLVSWGNCDPDGNEITEPGSGGYQGYDQIYFTPSSRQVLSELQSSMSRNQEQDSGNATTTAEAVPTTEGVPTTEAVPTTTSQPNTAPQYTPGG